jgi:hypothetical protein
MVQSEPDNQKNNAKDAGTIQWFFQMPLALGTMTLKTAMHQVYEENKYLDYLKLISLPV